MESGVLSVGCGYSPVDTFLDNTLRSAIGEVAAEERRTLF
jgi:hypothetical protein